jgi:hypothetical protein
MFEKGDALHVRRLVEASPDDGEGTPKMSSFKI